MFFPRAKYNDIYFVPLRYMKDYLNDINKRYRYKDGKLFLFRQNSGILRKTFFIVLPNEEKHIKDFVEMYNKLGKLERKYVDKTRNVGTLTKSWYYCQVWYHTISNLNKEELSNRNIFNVIDHIYPIIKGFVSNRPPSEIADRNNLQFITSKENLAKNTKEKAPNEPPLRAN